MTKHTITISCSSSKQNLSTFFPCYFLLSWVFVLSCFWGRVWRCPSQPQTHRVAKHDLEFWSFCLHLPIWRLQEYTTTTQSYKPLRTEPWASCVWQGLARQAFYQMKYTPNLKPTSFYYSVLTLFVVFQRRLESEERNFCGHQGLVSKQNAGI